MPTVHKAKRTSRASAADTARKSRRTAASSIDWSHGLVTQGGGVAATITAIRRGRGPNRKPTKEQVAVRFDRDVLTAFRASGRGWQTRMNAALKEWLATHR
jgi:uncharacterized protein (DUF4415 family)